MPTGTQIQIRFPDETKEWLHSESESSGRSITWLVNHAVDMWRNRLERDRSRRAAESAKPK